MQVQSGRHLKDVCSLHGEWKYLKMLPPSMNRLRPLSKHISSITPPKMGLRVPYCKKDLGAIKLISLPHI